MQHVSGRAFLWKVDVPVHTRHLPLARLLLVIMYLDLEPCPHPAWWETLACNVGIGLKIFQPLRLRASLHHLLYHI